MKSVEELKQAIQRMFENLEHLKKSIESARRNLQGDWFWEDVATYYIEQFKDMTKFKKELDGLVAKHSKTLPEIIKFGCPQLYALRCKNCLAQCEFSDNKVFAGKYIAVGEEEDTTVSHRLIRTCCSKHNEENQILTKNSCSVNPKKKQKCTFKKGCLGRCPKHVEVYGY